MPLVWMSRVTRVSASCHVYERVVSHKNKAQISRVVVSTEQQRSHVTCLNESRDTYEWVPMNEFQWKSVNEWVAYHPYAWSIGVRHVTSREPVMSHVWISHVTCLNESSHMLEWVTLHVWMIVVPLVCMRHATRRGASCPFAWMSHVTQQQGADLEVKGDDGGTALLHAAASGQVYIYGILASYLYIGVGPYSWPISRLLTITGLFCKRAL